MQFSLFLSYFILFLICLFLLFTNIRSPYCPLYYIKMKVPNKQYIIEESPRPRNIRYLIDASDLEYYKNQQSQQVHPIVPMFQPQVQEPFYLPPPGPISYIHPRLQPLDTRIPRQNTHMDFELEDDFFLPEFTQNTSIKDEAIRQTVNEPQSIHDTVIQSTTKKKYQENKENRHESTTQSDIIEQIINHNPSRKSEISSILSQIRKRNATITNFNGDSELDILVNVYTSGNENVKDQVILELLDCTKDNDKAIVCPTGVATRIVNAKFIENPESMPKSKAIIQSEMLQTASKMREDTEKDTSESSFKANLLQKYKDDYVSTGLLTQNEVDDIVNPWINAL